MLAEATATKIIGDARGDNLSLDGTFLPDTEITIRIKLRIPHLVAKNATPPRQYLVRASTVLPRGMETRKPPRGGFWFLH
ncbi:MAG: hypothetical protein ACK50Q_16165 [Labrys sp. (in: a-proteobacteria)]